MTMQLAVGLGLACRTCLALGPLQESGLSLLGVESGSKRLKKSLSLLLLSSYSLVERSRL